MPLKITTVPASSGSEGQLRTMFCPACKDKCTTRHAALQCCRICYSATPIVLSALAAQISNPGSPASTFSGSTASTSSTAVGRSTAASSCYSVSVNGTAGNHKAPSTASNPRLSPTTRARSDTESSGYTTCSYHSMASAYFQSGYSSVNEGANTPIALPLAPESAPAQASKQQPAQPQHKPSLVSIFELHKSQPLPTHNRSKIVDESLMRQPADNVMPKTPRFDLHRSHFQRKPPPYWMAQESFRRSGESNNGRTSNRASRDSSRRSSSNSVDIRRYGSDMLNPPRRSRSTRDWLQSLPGTWPSSYVCDGVASPSWMSVRTAPDEGHHEERLALALQVARPSLSQPPQQPRQQSQQQQREARKARSKKPRIDRWIRSAAKRVLRKVERRIALAMPVKPDPALMRERAYAAEQRREFESFQEQQRLWWEGRRALPIGSEPAFHVVNRHPSDASLGLEGPHTRHIEYAVQGDSCGADVHETRFGPPREEEVTTRRDGD